MRTLFAMALPLRCAASLRLAVSRLSLLLRVSDPIAVIDRRILESNLRQVADLPRIGVAEPEPNIIVPALVVHLLRDLPRIGVAEPEPKIIVPALVVHLLIDLSRIGVAEPEL